MKLLFSIIISVASIIASNVHGGELSSLTDLQDRWAEIKYQLPANKQEQAYVELVGKAKTLRSAHANEASWLIWEGIIRSTYAGAKGGLGALSEVKEAKALFEQAIKLEPGALSGSAYVSLGSLYYQVPGWPVGFGSDEKALAMLTKGLSYNPDGLDAHYFYGDFLLKQKRYQEAIEHFEKALNAPARPGRELADQGRKHEIEVALATARQKSTD